MRLRFPVLGAIASLFHSISLSGPITGVHLAAPIASMFTALLPQSLLYIAHHFGQQEWFDQLLAAARARALLPREKGSAAVVTASIKWGSSQPSSTAKGNTARGTSRNESPVHAAEGALLAVTAIMEAALALERAPGGVPEAITEALQCAVWFGALMGCHLQTTDAALGCMRLAWLIPLPNLPQLKSVLGRCSQPFAFITHLQTWTPSSRQQLPCSSMRLQLAASCPPWSRRPPSRSTPLRTRRCCARLSARPTSARLPHCPSCALCTRRLRSAGWRTACCAAGWA